MSRTLWMRFGVGLISLAVAGVLYDIISPFVLPLPTFMALPNVTLIDQDKQIFNLKQTRGKIVALSPIYTHCPDICPITTAKMKQLQDLIQAAGLSGQVQLVTFTVDPERDSPEVLNKFAGRFHAHQDNWIFLSGTSDQIHILIKDLSLYVERVYYINGTPVPESSFPQPTADTFYLVNHTDRLFLIDRQGNVRAFLPGSRTNVDNAMQLIRELVQN
jgi:protein SCO1